MPAAIACSVIGLVLLMALAAWFELDGEFHETPDVVVVVLIALIAVLLLVSGVRSLGSWWGAAVGALGIGLCLLIIRNWFQSFPRF